MRVLVPLLVVAGLVAADPPEQLPVPLLDATIASLDPDHALPLAAVGALPEDWKPAATGSDAAAMLRWGAPPTWVDDAAARSLASTGSGGRLKPSWADAPLVAVLAVPTSGGESVGVARVVQLGSAVRIELERDATPAKGGPPAARVLVLPIGRFSAGEHQLILDERDYAPWPRPVETGTPQVGGGEPRVFTMRSSWTLPFTVAAQPGQGRVAAVPQLTASLHRGVPPGEDEPIWQPPRCARRTFPRVPTRATPLPTPRLDRTGAFDLAAWDGDARAEAPPAGTTIAALVTGPTLSEGEQLLLDRVERVGGRWTITCSVWQDDGPRRENVLSASVLAVPLDADAAPAPEAVTIRCRWMRAPATGAAYREQPAQAGIAAAVPAAPVPTLPPAPAANDF